jgi:hypothetical protein
MTRFRFSIFDFGFPLGESLDLFRSLYKAVRSPRGLWGNHSTLIYSLLQSAFFRFLRFGLGGYLGFTERRTGVRSELKSEVLCGDYLYSLLPFALLSRGGGTISTVFPFFLLSQGGAI